MVQPTMYLPSCDLESLGRSADQWLSLHSGGGALVLAAEHEHRCVPSIQSLFTAKGMPVAGGVAPALIANDRFVHKGLIVAFVKEMFPYRLFSLQGKEKGIPELAGEISQALDPLMNEEPKCLFMLIDALFPAVASLLEGLYLNMADRVNYVGANMGSETFQPTPCIFDNESFIQGGALFAVMDDHGEAVLEHGYQAPENAFQAAASQGNRITYIDWRPALEVYREMARSHYGVTMDRDNFYQLGIHYPFGLIRMDGDPLVRIPVAIDEDDSLLCVGEIPDNAMLTLLKAVDPGENETVDKLAARLSDFQIDTVLTFYCAGRHRRLGEHATEEVGLLAERLSPRSVFGALSLGEIGPMQPGGLPLFHNATVVVMPWSD